MNMELTASCQIHCLKCKKWFNSPIQFGDYRSFFSSDLKGIITNCPFCGGGAICEKDYMRFVEDLGEGKRTIIEGRNINL